MGEIKLGKNSKKQFGRGERRVTKTNPVAKLSPFSTPGSSTSRVSKEEQTQVKVKNRVTKSMKKIIDLSLIAHGPSVDPN